MRCGHLGGQSVPAEGGAVTAVKQRQSGGEARLCPMKNANKDSRGSSAPRGAAVEVEPRPGGAKLDGGE